MMMSNTRSEQEGRSEGKLSRSEKVVLFCELSNEIRELYNVPCLVNFLKKHIHIHT